MIGASLSEYQAALAHPRVSLRDRCLWKARFVSDKFGRPRPLVGAGAAVWIAQTRRERLALRTFLCSDARAVERLAVIAAFLAQARPAGVVPFELLLDGMRLGDRSLPLMIMPVAEGEPLDEAIARRIGDPTKLRDMATGLALWHREMLNHGCAHGDVHPGNGVLTADDRALFFDHNPMFVPGLEGETALELGHPDFAHPRRTASEFDATIDDFPVRLLTGSLRVLAADASLWRTVGGGAPGAEHLLFRARDLQDPDRSPLFSRLLSHRDMSIRREAEALRGRCVGEVADQVVLAAAQATRDADRPGGLSVLRRRVTPADRVPALALRQPSPTVPGHGAGGSLFDNVPAAGGKIIRRRRN